MVMSGQYTKKEYSGDEINEIVSLYKNGMSFTKISKIVHRQKNNIKKILIDNKIFIEDRDKLKFIITDEIGKEIITQYKNGKSCEEIGKLYNITKNPIINILKEKDIIRQGYSNGKKIILTEEQKATIKILYLTEYKSSTEIAEITNLNKHFIDKYLSKSNFRRNRSKGNSIGLVKRFSGIPYNEYLKNITKIKKYYSDVMKVTNKQPIHSLPNYNKRGKSGLDGVYHLDHKFSIIEGFKNNISPEIIGGINNLEFIPWLDNLKKRTKCSINKQQLILI